MVESDDKRRARLNCISHILDTIEYEDALPDPIEPGGGASSRRTRRPPRGSQTEIIGKY